MGDARSIEKVLDRAIQQSHSGGASCGYASVIREGNALSLIEEAYRIGLRHGRRETAAK